MSLIEPQVGSDLAALRSRAERNDDGTYSVFGQKIFITYGEHDLTDNIVHLVLARLPDAPSGTRGISLFLVPKFLVEADGSLGARNDVQSANVEHKLGIHGSPTCTMVYGDRGGAKGWLVGEEHKGLACMFTMMNNARLAVGVQGLGVAEAALQHALAYAHERRQGKASGWTGEGMAPIATHPDIRCNLVTMWALTAVVRALCYRCAAAIDMAHGAEGEEKKRWAERAALLTLVAKAMPTDIGVEVSSLGVQIHGGMGYVEETGAAQFLRDARIAPIYEGTNGIQAIGLVTRKLPLSEGAEARGFIEEMREIVREAGAQNDEGFAAMARKVASRSTICRRRPTGFSMRSRQSGWTRRLPGHALSAALRLGHGRRAACARGLGDRMGRGGEPRRCLAHPCRPLFCRQPDRRKRLTSLHGDGRRRQPARCRCRVDGRLIEARTSQARQGEP